MAKKGMKRPEHTHVKPKNDIPPVPEIQGKTESQNSYDEKFYHMTPHENERPISEAYPVLDNDLARDNIENDIPSADLQDI